MKMTDTRILTALGALGAIQGFLASGTLACAIAMFYPINTYAALGFVGAATFWRGFAVLSKLGALKATLEKNDNGQP